MFNISENAQLVKQRKMEYCLSTYRPDAIDVAIPRKAKVSTLPDWPELNVCYFTDDREDGKIGIEETKEVLNNLSASK